MSKPTLPKIRYLLTKHRQRQRPHLPSSGASSISARCTYLHSCLDSNHPAAAIPAEWQPAPATRVTLLLPGKFFCKRRKEDGRGVRKIEVAEAESQTCGEQRLAKTGVTRWNLPDQSASSKRRTPDTGMNDLPSSQQPPANHATPAQDTGVSRIPSRNSRLG